MRSPVPGDGVGGNSKALLTDFERPWLPGEIGVAGTLGADPLTGNENPPIVDCAV